MAVVASALDEVDTLTETAKAFLKSTLADNESAYRKTVAYFLKFHRDELDPYVVKELFLVTDPSMLSLEEMVDFLKVKRFGCLVDSQFNKQLLIMDLSLEPEVTDELMVIYFDLDKQIVVVAYES